MEKINYNGKKFGRLTIIEDGNGLREGKKKLRSVLCKCDCGNEKELKLKYILRNEIKSCGCLAKEQKNDVQPGDKFGLWTVIGEGEGYISKGKKSRTTVCECVCGKTKDILLSSLVSGKSKSCSCQGKIRQEKIKKEKLIPQSTEEEIWVQSKTNSKYYISSKGNVYSFEAQVILKKRTAHELTHWRFVVKDEMYKSFIGDFDKNTHTVFLKSGKKVEIENIDIRPKNDKLVVTYSNMKARCNNPNNKDYKHYGARGIKVEESFSNINKFIKWAFENGYEDGLEIDRIDNNGNYNVENCRWVTRTQNCRNMSKNVLSEEIVKEIKYGKYKGMRANDIAKVLGCNQTTISNVLNSKTWADI